MTIFENMALLNLL